MCRTFDSEKICFSTENRANQFISNYSCEILQKRGFAPVRSYYSEVCCAWLVTSKYIVSEGYEKQIIADYEKECGTRLPNPHTLQQYVNHKEDALLYAIDKDICEACHCMLNGNAEGAYQFLDRIRTNYSLCQSIQRESSHKNKIAKFISCCFKVQSGRYSSERREKLFSRFNAYFQRKISFYEADTHVQNPDIERINKLSRAFYCNINKYYDYMDSDDFDLAQIFLQDALRIFNQIERNYGDDKVFSYKRKKIKGEIALAMEYHRAYVA